MKRGWRSRNRKLAYCACAIVWTSAQAQTDADARPNFNGVWLATPGSIVGTEAAEMGAPAPPQLTPEALRISEAYDLLTDDPAYECSPASVTRVWSNPIPIEIEQLPDRVLLRYEYMDAVRTVYLNPESHTPPASNEVLGHSIGRFEGSTLIIETTGFSTSFIGAVSGTPQTETLRTIERLTMTEDGQRFRLEIRHEDPATFTEPWTPTRDFDLTDLDRLDWDCVLEDAGYEDISDP